MRRVFALLVSAALASAPTGLAQTPPPAGNTGTRGQVVEGPVAMVNDQAISQSDVRARMLFMLLGLPGQRSPEVLREVQRQATQALIDEKLQYQEFKKMLKKAEVKPAEIDAEIEAIAKQNNMTTENFKLGLASEGVNIQTLRDKLEAEAAWQMLVGARYGRQVRVSDQRIDQRLERLKESQNKEQYRIAEIFLYAPDQQSRINAMERANTLKAEIEKGAEFSRVAQQFSAAPSASTGGDLGFISPGDMKPEILGPVSRTTTLPAVLPPIESEGGVYLVAVLGKREPADAKAATLDMKQVVATGPDAEQKLAAIKAAAKDCDATIAEAAKLTDVTVNPMNGLVLSQLSEQFRAILEPLQVGQSTGPLEAPNGKMALYVCKREQGAPLPPRNQIRNALFEQELSMLSDRYLRDVRREATIMMR